MSEAESEETETVGAVVLDYLPHGRSDDDRPQYQTPALAYALGEQDFRLFELEVDPDTGVTIGDRVIVEPPDERTAVTRVDAIGFEGLSGGAQSELEYVVEDVIEDDEEHFVNFYNDAQPITLRLHQLNLLPGIGKKLRNAILDEREREPFESFDDLEERVAGLHDPREVLVERVLEELRDEDLKYRTFVGRDAG